MKHELQGNVSGNSWEEFECICGVVVSKWVGPGISSNDGEMLMPQDSTAYQDSTLLAVAMEIFGQPKRASRPLSLVFSKALAD